MPDTDSYAMPTGYVNIVLDRDCPACGWPETVAENAGPDGCDRYACRKCDWYDGMPR